MKVELLSRSQSKWVLLGVIIAAMLLGAACSAGVTETPLVEPEPTATQDVEETMVVEPTPVPVEKLYENPWVLVAYGDPDDLIVLQSDTVVSAVFSPDGLLSGNSGCNQYQTSFNASSDGSMNIQPEIISTMMACPDGLMEVEQAYLQALPEVLSFGFSAEGRLEMGYALQDGTFGKMVFVVGEVPLEGTAWTLLSYGDPASLNPVSAGLVLTANFGLDGILNGNAGCNNYSTTYSAEDGQISIDPVAITMMACESGMELEQTFLEILGSAETYNVVGGNLSINAEDGRVLIFSSANLPLETTEWTFISMNAQPIPTDISVTLFLTPGEEEGQGSAGGKAGCNQYNSTYVVDGDMLSFSEFILTMMMCEEEEMQVEAAYLEALEASRSYQILGATLIINTEKGVMTYVADRTPLTGALWTLQSLGDIEDPQEPVAGSGFTAQFTRHPGAPTGVVAGTTGCNEYAAAYAANLTEIKINLPDSTENTTCVPGLLDQEQLYFLALNDAIEYRIIGNTLVIPYDNGQQALVFEGTQVGMPWNLPLTSLEAKTWYLWTINEQPIVNGTTITSDFFIDSGGRSGTMRGSAGCNLYQATFGDYLGMETTLNANELCVLPKGVMDQEKVYMDALSRAYGYWLTDDQLIINSGSGALTYRTSPAPQSSDQSHLLQANDWYLVSYNTSLSAPGSLGDPTLRFDQAGELSGYTGCNAVSGSYSTNLNKISVSDLTKGQEACPNTVLAEQEKAIMDVLGSAQTYNVIESSMQLVGSAGVLNFYFAPVNNPEDVVPPKAVITAPTQAKVGEVVTFSASESTAQVPITGYSWDFGDGEKGRGEVVKHVYEDAGTFFVQMTVTDARGFRNSATMNIEILPLVEPTEPPTPEPTQPPEATATPKPTQAPPTPEPTQPPAEEPPTAEIQGPGEGFPGEPVTFSASGSQPGSSPIINYQWDFGDGTSRDTGDQPQVTTIYNQSGTYDVSVVVTDQNGLSDSATTQVVINARLDTDVWLLHELMGQPLVPGTSITLQFLDGVIAGFAGCNTYTGSYTVQENEDGTVSVEISDLQLTQIGCPEAIMKQEALYLQLLSTSLVAQIQGNALRLRYPEGTDPDGQPYPESELLFYELGTPVPY